ncbi:hypothetical protein [Pararhodobacter oceanensis]|uniref:hypothetical protein n=1 Tax=Pararhodobacter oceanensis TaxID=2172121 RepID=UPI001057D799|nr:hypothetical protein [Pararhodobacter oceanensis]
MPTMHYQTHGDGSATLHLRKDPGENSDRSDLSQTAALLEVLLRAESVLDEFPEGLPLNRHRAALALEMVAANHLRQAAAMFQGIIDLSNGSVSAHEFGFSEFDDNEDE